MKLSIISDLVSALHLGRRDRGGVGSSAGRPTAGDLPRCGAKNIVSARKGARAAHRQHLPRELRLERAARPRWLATHRPFEYSVGPHAAEPEV